MQFKPKEIVESRDYFPVANYVKFSCKNCTMTHKEVSYLNSKKKKTINLQAQNSYIKEYC